MDKVVSRSDRLRVAIAVLAYAAALQIAFLFPAVEDILAAIWPAAGVGLAMLLLNPRHLWPALLLLFFVTGVLSNLLADRSLPASLGFMTANTLESGLCAWVIVRLCGPTIRFTRVREVAALIGAATLVNAGTATLGAATGALTSSAPFGDFYATWWIGNGLGLLIITPLIVSWKSFRDFTRRDHWTIELVIFMGVWCIASVNVFQSPSSPLLLPPYPYLLFILIAYAALRFDQRGVTLALELAALIAVISEGVIEGPLLWGGGNHTERLTLAQLYLASLAITGLLLTSSYTEIQSAERTARASETHYHSLFENMLNGLAYCRMEFDQDRAVDFTFLEVNSAFETLTGLKNVIGKKVSETIPGILTSDPDLLGIYGRIARTGQPERFEYYLNSLEMWLSASVYFPEKGYFVAIFDIVTERKRAEEQLRHSEMSLKQAQSVAHVGSWRWDIKMNRLEWSDEMYRIFGIDKERFTGYLPDVVAQAIHPDDRAAVESSNLSVSSEGKPIPLEYRIILPDQSIRTVWAEAGGLIVDETGAPAVLTGIVQDITERKRAEAALRESEEKFRNIIESSPLGMHMYQLDADNRLIFIDSNPAADEILGVNNRQFIGQTIEDAFPPLAETEVPERYRLAAAQNIPWRTEQINYEDQQITGAFEVRAFQTSPGKMVAMFYDITERKRAEEALRQSEERYRLIADSTSDSIWAMTPDLHFTYQSPSTERLFGYTVPEWQTLDWSVFVHLDDMDSVLKIFEDLLRSQDEHSATAVIRVHHKDGREMWAEFTASPVRGPQGELMSVVGVTRDITERKQAELALANAKAMVDAAFAQTPIPMALISLPDMILRYTNNATREFLGITDEPSYIGQSLLEFTQTWRDFDANGQLQKMEDMPLARAARGEFVYNREYYVITKQGIQRWNLTSASPIYNQNGELIAAYVIFPDITERKRVEEELEQHRNHLEDLVRQRTAELHEANEQLIALSRVQDEFVSNVSHELRSPITSLTLRHSLLRRAPDKLNTHLDVMVRETTRLAHTIDDLLRLSRLDQGRIEAVFNPTDLNQVAEHLVHDRMLQAQEKNLALMFEECADLPLVQADAGLLEQVMSILLTNAINYTLPGGQITISIHSEDQRVGFKVRDTGLGILPEEYPRLFERFFQGTANRQAKVRGTGLGLAIAKEIVDLHQGRIDVESTGIPGEGSTFSVWLNNAISPTGVDQ